MVFEMYCNLTISVQMLLMNYWLYAKLFSSDVNRIPLHLKSHFSVLEVFVPREDAGGKELQPCQAQKGSLHLLRFYQTDRGPGERKIQVQII